MTRKTPLKEVLRSAKNPNITNDETIDSLMWRLSSVPLTGCFHPEEWSRAENTPWQKVLEELGVPLRAVTELDFGEIVYLISGYESERIGNNTFYNGEKDEILKTMTGLTNFFAF